MYIRPTYSQWLLMFPAGTFPSFTQNVFDLHNDKVDIYLPPNYSFRSTKLYTMMFNQCMAHFAWEYEKIASGDFSPTSGLETSSSVGSVRSSYQKGLVSNEVSLYFRQSRFGNEFMNLLHICIKRDFNTSLVQIGVV